MKPLSETELREKIDDYVDRFRMQWVVEGDEYHQSELIEDIVQLIIQDRKAWGEHNSKPKDEEIIELNGKKYKLLEQS